MARDRGAMLVFTVMAGTALCGAVVVALVPFLVDLVQLQQAQAAADAAALAGVTGGRPAAEQLAAANDGVLVSWSRDGRDVTVTVAVGDQRATARATDDP